MANVVCNYIFGGFYCCNQGLLWFKIQSQNIYQHIKYARNRTFQGNRVPLHGFCQYPTYISKYTRIHIECEQNGSQQHSIPTSAAKCGYHAFLWSCVVLVTCFPHSNGNNCPINASIAINTFSVVGATGGDIVKCRFNVSVHYYQPVIKCCDQ